MSAAPAMAIPPDNAAAPAPEVLVLGMGATGASCARWFAARGVRAAFADTRPAPPHAVEIRRLMPDAPLQPGAIPAVPPAGLRRIVVSPGVDFDLPLLAEARRRGIPVESDLDLFAAEARAPLLGVTGSNGKSTVTTMLGAMLRADGWRAAEGANLGTPALDLLDPAVQAYVLELSSFQLERSRALPLRAAVVLNLTPDHLDRHGGMAAYGAAKARIYARCEVAVVNRDEPALAAMVPRGRPRTTFGLGPPGPGEFGVRLSAGREHLAFGGETLLAVDELRVAGRHNVSNALAALALGHAFGARLPGLVGGLRDFAGLPHRMQVVASADGLRWIDDSKATNVGAAVTSVGGLTGPFVLIAGGDAKGQSFEDLAAVLRGRPAHVLLLGRDRDVLARALAAACPVELVDTLPAAVRRARELAAPGATVLLAPACSSLDMFRSYEERGQVFARAVAETTP